MATLSCSFEVQTAIAESMTEFTKEILSLTVTSEATTSPLFKLTTSFSTSVAIEMASMVDSTLPKYTQEATAAPYDGLATHCQVDSLSSTEDFFFGPPSSKWDARKLSVCSQPLSSPRSPRPHRWSPFTNSTDRDSRRGSLSSVVFSPRPYEALFSERAYLSNSLEELTNKRLEMMGQYSAAAQELEEVSDNAKQRRRLRKRLSLLRSKINQVVEQQKSLFLRLGELHLELESREVWAKTRQDVLSVHSVGSDSTSSRCTSSPLQGSIVISGPITPLQATSPEFFPGQNMGDMQLGRRSSLPRTDSASSSESLKLATVDEAGEEFSSNHGLEYEYKDGEYIIISEERPSLRRRNSFDSEEMTPRQRRMSLPNLHSLWPEE